MLLVVVIGLMIWTIPRDAPAVESSRISPPITINMSDLQIVSDSNDTVPPYLEIISPSNGSIVAGTVDLIWRDSDAGGIARKEIDIDGGGWLDATDIPGYPNEIDILQYRANLILGEDGVHTIQIRVIDLAGNAALEKVMVISDTSPPELSIIGPQDNEKISRSDIDVSWSGTDSGTSIDRYEIQVDGGTWIDVGAHTTYQFTGLDDGWHTITVKAIDQIGNSATTTVGFGIYTSIWSQYGPYAGVPSYALIGGLIVVLILGSVLVWKRVRI